MQKAATVSAILIKSWVIKYLEMCYTTDVLLSSSVSHLQTLIKHSFPLCLFFHAFEPILCSYVLPVWIDDRSIDWLIDWLISWLIDWWRKMIFRSINRGLRSHFQLNLVEWQIDEDMLKVTLIIWTSLSTFLW